MLVGRFTTGAVARCERRWIVRSAVVSLSSVLAMTLAACTPATDRPLIEGEIEESADPAFYTSPTSVSPGKPGEIVRQERLLSAPDDSVAWRVLYHSTDVAGTDTVLAGVIIAPDSPAPASGRTVIGWGHPTAGAVADCAPSSGVDPFDSIEGLKTLLDDGYAVAAADYPGLGVPGQNTYLVGISEANSVLDLVRAAQHLTATGVSGNSDVLLWGHSQGGHAVLFAAQSAKTYAPELKVKAVAVATPAADLGIIFDDDIPDASSDPATTEPWATMLAENTPGATPLGVPLYVAQGASDTLVLPSATQQFVAKQCAGGQHLTFESYPDTGHGLIALKAVPAVTAFFDDVLAGTPPASTC